jgi:hypothetical protein
MPQSSTIFRGLLPQPSVAICLGRYPSGCLLVPVRSSQAPVCLWAVGQEEVYLWVVRYPRSRLWQSVWAVTQVAVYLVPVRSFQVAVCLWAVGQEEVHLWVVRHPRSCHTLGVVPSSSLWALAPPSIFFRGR